MEHIASVMRVADALCSVYPERLNRDLVLAGALLHDCGKIVENDYEEHSLEMPYTESGAMPEYRSLDRNIPTKSI